MTQFMIEQIVTNVVAIAALGAVIGSGAGLACLAMFSNGPKTLMRATALGALVLPAMFWAVHIAGPQSTFPRTISNDDGSSQTVWKTDYAGDARPLAGLATVIASASLEFRIWRSRRKIRV